MICENCENLYTCERCGEFYGQNTVFNAEGVCEYCQSEKEDKE